MKAGYYVEDDEANDESDAVEEAIGRGQLKIAQTVLYQSATRRWRLLHAEQDFEPSLVDALVLPLRLKAVPGPVTIEEDLGLAETTASGHPVLDVLDDVAKSADDALDKAKRRIVGPVVVAVVVIGVLVILSKS